MIAGDITVHSRYNHIVFVQVGAKKDLEIMLDYWLGYLMKYQAWVCATNRSEAQTHRHIRLTSAEDTEYRRVKLVRPREEFENELYVIFCSHSSSASMIIRSVHLSRVGLEARFSRAMISFPNGCAIDLPEIAGSWSIAL
jgi:hypothetical protein